MLVFIKYALLYFHSSFAIIMTRKRELVALLLLSFGCLVTVNSLLLFLRVLSVCLQYVIVVFPNLLLLKHSKNVFAGMAVSLPMQSLSQIDTRLGFTYCDETNSHLTKSHIYRSPLLSNRGSSQRHAPGINLPMTVLGQIRPGTPPCKYVLKRVSFGSKDCTNELKLECAYFLGQTS